MSGAAGRRARTNGGCRCSDIIKVSIKQVAPGGAGDVGDVGHVVREDPRGGDAVTDTPGDGASHPKGSWAQRAGPPAQLARSPSPDADLQQVDELGRQVCLELRVLGQGRVGAGVAARAHGGCAETWLVLFPCRWWGVGCATILSASLRCEQFE